MGEPGANRVEPWELHDREHDHDDHTDRETRPPQQLLTGEPAEHLVTVHRFDYPPARVADAEGWTVVSIKWDWAAVFTEG